MNSGLDGLGVINTNNASATIEPSNMNMGTTVNQYASDNRKFSTSANQFNSIENYFNYLYNFMGNTGVLNVNHLDDNTKQQFGFSFLFYAQFMTSDGNASENNGFCIIACPGLENVKSIIELLRNSSSTIIKDKRVAIGYFNSDNTLKNMAKQVGLELVGYEELLDLNNAIDSADNKMPYMNISGNSFEAMLAKRLHEKYKQTATGSFGQQFSNQASGVGASLGAAFSEGLGQLKQSLFGLGKDLGIVKNQNQQAMNNNQQDNVCVQQSNNQGVNLGKQENPNLNLEMNTSTPSLNNGSQEHNLDMNTTQPLDIQAHHVVLEKQETDSTNGVSLSKEEHKGVSLSK